MPTTSASIAPRRRLRHACLAGAAAGLLAYLAILWDFGFRPLRRMTAIGVNADFFDIQARALFHGHLDVPPGSLGIEAFVVDGRHYMYFPPFPAIIRMPILAITDRLDGELTAISMLAGWFVLALALTWLFGLLRTALRGDAPIGRLELVAFATLTASVTGGSALLYVASEPWVYHEVYVWSAALTVATAASLVAAWTDPSRRRIIVTFALATATMLTRFPAGWAMSFAVIGTGVGFVVARRDAGADRPWRRAGWGLVGAGVLTIAIGSAVNWAKFRHPYRFPIADQVWSQFSTHRRIALAFNDGRLDGLDFVWTTLLAYFRPDGIRFVPYFPFVTAPADPPRAVSGVLLDESFRTGSIPAFMPLLFVLAVWGLVTVLRPGGPAGVAGLRLPLLGTLLAAGPVMAFAYIAPRYTAEFIPVLAVGAGIGLTDVVRRLRARPIAWRRAALGAIVAIAAFGVVANGSVALVNARHEWRGGRLERLIAIQHAVSSLTGNPLDAKVREVEVLPAHGAPDELAIVGDCDALYVGTGERSGSWIPVQFRERTFRVEVGPEGARPARVSLMRFGGSTLRQLDLQVGVDERARVVMTGTPPDTSGRWFDVGPNAIVEVTVRGDTARNTFVVSAGVAGDPAASVVSAPMTEWNQQFVSVPITPHVAIGAAEAARAGVSISATTGPVPDLCDDLRN